MTFDLWSHFRGDTMLRSQLADRIVENDALRDENATLRARVETLEQVLELCLMAAGAALDREDDTEDGDEARGT